MAANKVDCSHWCTVRTRHQSSSMVAGSVFTVASPSTAAKKTWVGTATGKRSVIHCYLAVLLLAGSFVLGYTGNKWYLVMGTWASQTPPLCPRQLCITERHQCVVQMPVGLLQMASLPNKLEWWGGKCTSNNACFFFFWCVKSRG